MNRLYHTRLGRQSYNTSGLDVLEQPWDNLVILDACRYDLFRTVYGEAERLPGELAPVESKGANTVEFLKANFAGRTLHDTVYVTANPQLYRYRNAIDVEFHSEQHIWREEGWDNEAGTVRPETVTEYALNAAVEFRDKRLIVHYMQPHYPFLHSDTEFDKDHLQSSDLADPNFWEQIMSGDLQVSRQQIWELYEDNLRALREHLEVLLKELAGRTVVTSDHGNMVGERARPIPVREWGHPRGIYTPELVMVPWLVHRTGTRREIVAEPPRERSGGVAEHIVVDRLRDLGYVE